MTSRSGPASAKPPPTADFFVSAPWRYVTMPVRSAATIGKWPGSTPNSPCTLGAVTSSTVAARARPFGVTISSSILSATIGQFLPSVWALARASAMLPTM